MTRPTPTSPKRFHLSPWRRAAWALVAALAVGLVPTGLVQVVAAGHVAAAADAAPRDVALVLGAAAPNGVPSAYLQGRLEVAKQLYDSGKAKVILVSGDNMHHGYDEPTAMFDWLTAHGVPADRVVRDYAGFDTYDSCVRARTIFGVDHLTVVTQGYHVPRAVATCRLVGVDAVGAGDGSVASRWPGSWARGCLRETAAAWKMLADVVLSREPVLGNPETAVQDALRRP